MPLIPGKKEAKELHSQETFLKERQFMTLLKNHVDEALKSGFDDSLTKFKGKSHFVVILMFYICKYYTFIWVRTPLEGLINLC